MAEFEHGLFLLLLLVGVLNAKPPRPNLALGILLLGYLLAFIPPAVRVPIPWDGILALTIPALLWQNGRRLVGARWRRDWAELGLWALAALGLGAIVWLDPSLGWTGAILFGLLAASAIWRSVEPEEESSHLSQLGPLTLIFLLAEVAPSMETPSRYLGGLFSGAAVGIAVAFLAIRLSSRVSRRQRTWIALGQVYVAYGIGLAIDSSGVVAAVLSVVVYFESGVSAGLWKQTDLIPAPLNSGVGFGAMLVLLLFLGWETHRPLTASVLLEVGLGLAVGILVTGLGRVLGIPWFSGGAIWSVGLRVGLLLFPALLLWPRTTLLQPLPLAVAAGIAALVSVLTASILSPLITLQESTSEAGYEQDPATLLDELTRDDR
jgi:hypothetical protein